MKFCFVGMIFRNWEKSSLQSDAEILDCSSSAVRNEVEDGMVTCDAHTPTSHPIPTNNRYNAAQIFSNPEACRRTMHGNEQENTLLHKNVKWPLGWQSSGYHLNLR
ncbi:glutamine synthetase N-1-like [Salvia splendens]|uniref:glutamine synthetase N-1-like n=1 Tax=Salvia splendens TaxID=180675 RepID=UPI001C253520|nr:glutamine synthetase N-1-like [Salvia splendens]